MKTPDGRGPRAARWGVLVAVSLLAATAQAAGLQVAPTLVKVPAARSAEGLTLANTSAAPLRAQTRVFRWTQHDGDDVLEPTTDLALSPPMLEIDAGGQQLVRIVRLVAPPLDGVEASYRVLVDELPIEVEPSPAGAGLRFVLRYSIPVFLAPAGAVEVAPRLRATLRRQDGRQLLEVSNAGNGHAQVADLAFEHSNGASTALAGGLAGYVLPGQRRQWPVPDHIDASADGVFRARVNGEAERRTLAFDVAQD